MSTEEEGIPCYAPCHGSPVVNQTGALQGRGFIDIHKIDKVRKRPRHSVGKLQIFYWNRDEPIRVLIWRSSLGLDPSSGSKHTRVAFGPWLNLQLVSCPERFGEGWDWCALDVPRSRFFRPPTCRLHFYTAQCQNLTLGTWTSYSASSFVKTKYWCPEIDVS